MGHGPKASKGLAADTLRGAVGGEQFGGARLRVALDGRVSGRTLGPKSSAQRQRSSAGRACEFRCEAVRFHAGDLVASCLVLFCPRMTRINANVHRSGFLNLFASLRVIRGQNFFLFHPPAIGRDRAEG